MLIKVSIPESHILVLKLRIRGSLPPLLHTTFDLHKRELCFLFSCDIHSLKRMDP